MHTHCPRFVAIYADQQPFLSSQDGPAIHNHTHQPLPRTVEHNVLAIRRHSSGPAKVCTPKSGSGTVHFAAANKRSIAGSSAAVTEGSDARVEVHFNPISEPGEAAGRLRQTAVARHASPFGSAREHTGLDGWQATRPRINWLLRHRLSPKEKQPSGHHHQDSQSGGTSRK